MDWNTPSQPKLCTTRHQWYSAISRSPRPSDQSICRSVCGSLAETKDHAPHGRDTSNPRSLPAVGKRARSASVSFSIHCGVANSHEAWDHLSCGRCYEQLESVLQSIDEGPSQGDCARREAHSSLCAHHRHRYGCLLGQRLREYAMPIWE